MIRNSPRLGQIVMVTVLPVRARRHAIRGDAPDG
jgi:hypothetical protein